MMEANKGNVRNNINFSNKILRRLIFQGFRLSYHGIADWFLLGLFVLPTYFGVRLAFFDLTVLRLFEVLLLLCIFKSKERKHQFTNLIKKCPFNIWIAPYMFVVIYTNLIHPSLNAIFYWITNGVLAFYCMSYLIVYEYGINGFLYKLRQFTWLITIVSPLELIIGRPPFAFLDTLGKAVTKSRFGSVRILGNCTTANGFAMYLMILFPLMCFDWEKNKIDFGKNKFLLILIILNIFLTGSRLSVGTLLLGFVLCSLFQHKKELSKYVLSFVVILPVIIFIIYLFRDMSFVKGILRTIFSAVDAVLGTNYSVDYGADAQVLYNSSYYRELLWKNTFLGNWLNPWLGRGGNYNFGMYIEGYRIYSCDNFYVMQYITYAWPGVITWLVMSVSFLLCAVKRFARSRDIIWLVCIVSIICYYISLWYLDQLQTFPYMMSIFALIYGAGVEVQKVN